MYSKTTEEKVTYKIKPRTNYEPGVDILTVDLMVLRVVVLFL